MPHNAAVAAVRAPRVLAQINGSIVKSIMNVDLRDRGSCRSSEFELIASINREKSESQWLELLQGKVTVEIYMHPQSIEDNLTMFEGLADYIAFDPINGTVRLSGRDYSSVLSGSTYQDLFCNQTASEIATYIAARHGFDANIAPTSAMVGTYQCDGYSEILLNAHSPITSEWDLLKRLATREGFELFVNGTTLIFGPLESLVTRTVSIDLSDVMDIKFYQNCPLSDQTTLVVKSWNSWLGQSLSCAGDLPSGQATVVDSGLKGDSAIEIAIIKPNLTAEGTESLAQRHLGTLSQTALTVQITMPGEMSMKPRDVITITGSDTVYDASYIISSVHRHFSATAGFIQYVRGFGTSSNSQFLLKTGITSGG
jgi:hypothetical protein